MEREALKLALEALTYIYTETTADEDELIDQAITAIKAALAHPAQEPVAWMVYTQDGKSVYVTDNPNDIQEGQRALPLYTTPPQRDRVIFPTMLRKMWSGGEVQAWLDENVNKEKSNGT